MGNAARPLEKTYDEYLAIERATDQKHEWIDGVVYAMAGGSLAHNRLSAQVIVELARLIGDRPCGVYTSDQKTRSARGRLAAYPDVTVVCGEPVVHDEDPNAITNPVVLVEVLSDSTEVVDRTTKFQRYRRLPSLKDYVLVSQHERSIEVYSRDPEGNWVLREASAGGRVPLSAFGASIEVDRVYRGVVLEPPSPDE